MINFSQLKDYCRGDYTKIENYEKALNDPSCTYHCHHRLEIAPFSGKGVSKRFLIEQRMYFDQPPEALIFLTNSEHTALHNSVYKVGNSFAKGNKSRLGQKKSEEECRKISESRKGIEFSEEHRRKISEYQRGRKHWTNGLVNVNRRECPEGFWTGWTKKSN